MFPLTVAVQARFAVLPLARVAIGDGLVTTAIVAVPPSVSAEAVTLLSVRPVLLVTRMVNVNVAPLYSHAGLGLGA